MNSTEYYGYLLGTALSGVDETTRHRVEGWHKRAAKDDFAHVGKFAAGKLYDLMVLGNRHDTPAAGVFHKMSTSDTWPNSYTEVVLRCWGSVKDATESHEKRAVGRTGGAGISAAGKLAPLFAKVILGGSVAAGGLAGGLHWGVQRQVDQDVPQLEALRAKADFYTDLALEAERELDRMTEDEEGRGTSAGRPIERVY